MSVDSSQSRQWSLFDEAAWRTTVQIEPNHRLVTLSKSIPWEKLMEKGYLLVMAPENPKISDQPCVLESLSLHRTVFDAMPKTYGTDRGMSSIENLEICLSAGVEKIAIQPKGKARALVNRRDLRELANRRAGIEPRIGHLKTRGMGRSRMKSDEGDLISGYRSALSWNLSLLMRDLTEKATEAVPRC